jgi:D-arabinose 1-dehydrogenase-like Zn-dependent alcohol dehydrogenase
MGILPDGPFSHGFETSQVKLQTPSKFARFFKAARDCGFRTTVTTFPLREANLALERLRAGALQGAAVLVP